MLLDLKVNITTTCLEHCNKDCSKCKKLERKQKLIAKTIEKAIKELEKKKKENAKTNESIKKALKDLEEQGQKWKK